MRRGLTARRSSPPETELVHDAAPVVLHEDVALLDDLLDDRDGFGFLQVERDVQFPDVLLREVGRHRADTRVSEPCEVTVRRLHLDDLGAEIAQHACAVRAREDTREVDDTDPVERTRLRRIVH
jgi:hypothetical protein